ncbi:DUF6283 family protein [Micromonospora sp. NPDC000668]|uniref:DUF6283 family protein n=1 Tax=Micromonospora sp. NPDC000668 TaxID=3364219 RepID=UPI00367514F5
MPQPSCCEEGNSLVGTRQPRHARRATRRCQSPPFHAPPHPLAAGGRAAKVRSKNGGFPGLLTGRCYPYLRTVGSRRSGAPKPRHAHENDGSPRRRHRCLMCCPAPQAQPVPCVEADGEPDGLCPGDGLRASVRGSACPCRTCPWRLDTGGRVPCRNLSEYAAGTVPGEPGFGVDEPDDPHAALGLLFACHSTAEADVDTLCAGHLAVVGHAHPLVRLGAALGLIDPAVLDAGRGWPGLHASYEDMLAATDTRPETP